MDSAPLVKLRRLTKGRLDTSKIELPGSWQRQQAVNWPHIREKLTVAELARRCGILPTMISRQHHLDGGPSHGLLRAVQLLSTISWSARGTARPDLQIVTGAAFRTIFHLYRIGRQDISLYGD